MCVETEEEISNIEVSIDASIWYPKDFIQRAKKVKLLWPETVQTT